MKIFTKRQWISWMRWSLLAVIAHAIILGLIYDWNIFSCYQREVRFLWLNVPFDNFYPRILETLVVPIFLLYGQFVINWIKSMDLIEGWGTFSISVYVLSSLIFGFIKGLYFEVIMVLIFIFIIELPVILRWLQGMDIEEKKEE